jgi:group I intron endonuclease
MKTNYNSHSNESGIYQIRNESNGRLYIGSAKEFKARYKQHIASLTKGTHHNKFLQNDFNKCGTDAFVFEVLEVTTGSTVERRIIEESYLNKFFDKCTNCYNVKNFTLKRTEQPWDSSKETSRLKLIEAQRKSWANDLERKKARSELSKKMWATEEYRIWKISKQTGRKNSEEQKKRMSAAALSRKPDSEETKKIKALAAKRRFQNPEQREKLAEISRNKPPASEETCKKISASNRGRLVSPETRKKISESNKGRTASEFSRRRSVECKQKTYNVFIIDPEGTEHFLGTNLANFCRERNLSICGIHALVHKKIKFHKGWTLKKNYKEFKSQQDTL